MADDRDKNTVLLAAVFGHFDAASRFVFYLFKLLASLQRLLDAGNQVSKGGDVGEELQRLVIHRGVYRTRPIKWWLGHELPDGRFDAFNQLVDVPFVLHALHCRNVLASFELDDLCEGDFSVLLLDIFSHLLDSIDVGFKRQDVLGGRKIAFIEDEATIAFHSFLYLRNLSIFVWGLFIG